MKTWIVLCGIIMTGCASNRVYVVRHAEKTIMTRDSANMMANDPPLSEAGKVRAFVLKDQLLSKNIRHIYSTNTIRTISTAEPLAQSLNGVSIEKYGPGPDSLQLLLTLLKSIKKGNALVVGHSNTVDDIVNGLMGNKTIPGDLRDGDYDNLFIITRKGKKLSFERKKYGYPSNPE